MKRIPFIVIAILAGVLFGDAISELLNLYGSKAAVGDKTLIINDQNETNPDDDHGYLDLGEYDGTEYITPADSDTGRGYVTLQ